MKKIKFKKPALLTGLVTALTTLVLSACGPSNNVDEKLLKSMEADQAAVGLKTSLAGYSKDDMEILANKQEIAKESEVLIKTFNKFYGTNLKFTQVGGATSLGQYTSTKFANGPGKVLLFGTGALAGFQGIIQHLVDTPASKMLKNDNTTAGEFLINNKHFMPAAVESIGLIYNKKVFSDNKITVYEGKTFEQATSKPTDLVKPTDEYNGVIEKDVNNTKNLYVFTSDLKLDGYKKLNTFLEAKNVKPVYTTSKAGEGNIWPLTNHLLGAVVNAQTNLQPNDPKLNTDANAVLTDDVMTNMKDALEIYGHNKEYNKNTNTVDLAMQNLALGQYAMSQNGTWALPQILNANSQADVGFLPMPSFSKDTKTANLYRTVSQRWGMTTLGNDEAKAKTAKLFLQYLYQTKSGLEYGANKMQLFSPFKQVAGVTLQLNDKLAASSLNYTTTKETVDNYFVDGFNNSDAVLRTEVNNGFANPAATKTALISEFNKLKAAVDAKKTSAA